MTVGRAALVLASLLLAGEASAEACRSGTGQDGAGKAGEPCRPSRRLEPYDPDRPRPGRNPGFIDLGNGTEVRVGGRVRMDYDVRR